MRFPKFFNFFRTLREEELKLFQKYLKRQYGSHGDALAVFDYVKKFHPDFRAEKKLTLDYIHRKVFGVEIDSHAHNRTKLLNIFSDLNLWLKAFLLTEKANSDTFESRHLWLTILKERALLPDFSADIAALQTELAHLPRQNVMDYWKCATVDQWFFDYLAHYSSLPQSKAFQPLADSIGLYHLLVRLKMACEAVNLKNIDQEQLFPSWLQRPEIPDWLDTDQYPLLRMYRAVYELLAGLGDRHYAGVEAILTAHAGQIDPLELDILLTYMRNYTSSQVRHGEEQPWQKIHQLDKLGITHDIWKAKGTITTTQYHNIVNTAGKANASDWGESFISEYETRLPENLRDDAVLLARCILLFEQKEYAVIAEKLAHMNPRDLYLFIRLKTMMLRCYYELDRDQNTILDYCTASEYGLKRFRKTGEEAVVATFHFIRLVKMLVRQKMPREAVVSKIQSTVPVFFKTWLLEKAKRYNAKFAPGRPGR